MALDTTACQRVKVKAMSVCRGPDTGQKVSVRVRAPGDPESTHTVALGCIQVSVDSTATALVDRAVRFYLQTWF